MTRVTIFADSDSTRDSSNAEKKADSSRLELHFSQNDSTRVTINDSRLESESFLQNLLVPDGQIQFVCTQRNEHFASVIIKIVANFLF